MKKLVAGITVLSLLGGVGLAGHASAFGTFPKQQIDPVTCAQLQPLASAYYGTPITCEQLTSLWYNSSGQFPWLVYDHHPTPTPTP